LNFQDDISRFSSIFIDTAPMIYFMEENPEFGPLVKMVMEKIRLGHIHAFTSVVTLMEVLPHPIRKKEKELAVRYTSFMSETENLVLLEISMEDAVLAGRFRAKYASLRGLDALQVAVAINAGTAAFLTQV